jgi:hypothetical protein
VAVGAVARVDGVETSSVSTTVALRPLGESRRRRGDAGGLRADADEQGYLFFRGLLPASDVLALRRRVLDACHDLGWLHEAAPIDDGVVAPGVRIGAYDETWVRLQCDVVARQEFVLVREHPEILAVLEQVFGGPVRSGRGDTCRVFSPGCPELTTLPHQDHFYVRGATALWTVWVPLGDCPVELGGLVVVPGSHAAGLQSHAGDGAGRQGVDVGPEVVWACADYRCGDVLMFNSLTLHRALDNRSADRLRVSADFRYEPETSPRGESGSMATP